MIYNGILWFCCLYISNIWWEFTSVNWGPSIAIHISLPKICVTNSRPEPEIGVVSAKLGVVNQTCGPSPSFLNSSPPPPQKKILYETDYV